jgi:hypothetical protein
MESILGELCHGPERFSIGTPGDPTEARERRLAQTDHFHEATKTLARSGRPDTVDSVNLQGATPGLKTKRSRSVSRAVYDDARQLDDTIDRCVEYEVDSRRLGPRLLKVQGLYERLGDARGAQEATRQKARITRRQFEEVRSAEEGKLEEQLEDEMIEYGTHRPKGLPIEFAKVSSKVLELRARERKAAWFRRYDEAEELRKEAHKKERQDLDANQGRFARSYALQKQDVARKQDTRRDVFHTHWGQKKEQSQRPVARQMQETTRAVEHWERDVGDAESALGAECGRVARTARIVGSTVTGRRRF